MAIGLYPKNAWFSFTLQIIWAVVAATAIIKILCMNKNGGKNESRKNK